MNRELITVIEQIGREKGIDKEILFEALESALLSASKKTLGAADNVRMHLDRQTGVLHVYGRKRVVTEVADAKLEISLADAKALFDLTEVKTWVLDRGLEWLDRRQGMEETQAQRVTLERAGSSQPHG